MSIDKFRQAYGHLGLVCELLIANVIVGQLSWYAAGVIADALTVRSAVN